MGYVDKALMAHLKSTLHTGFTPLSDTIAVFSETDIIMHYFSMADLGLPDTVVALILSASRTAGTGFLYVWPMDGALNLQLGPAGHEPQVVCCIINERLKYSQTVANDDFSLFCHGYWTVGRLSG